MSRFSLKDWFDNGDARVSKFVLSKAYSRNAWVYSCVRAIGHNIAGIPLLFTRPDGEVITDRMEDPYGLFLKPSSVFDPAGASLIRDTVMLQELRGFAFWALEVKNKQVIGLKLKRPEVIIPVLKDEELLGWSEIDPTSRMQKKVYLPDEVVIFKDFSPDSIQGSVSPVEAGRLDLEQDFNMSAWNAAFFRQGAKKDIKLETEKPMNRAQRRQFLKELTESRQGTEDAHGYLLLTGGVKGSTIDTGGTELAFKESRHLTREAICAAFGVPPAVVGIFRYANYANSQEQRKIFWEQTLIPKMNQMADVIQLHFLDKWYPGYSCMWDFRQIKAFKQDVSEQAGAAKTYFDMGYTREEVALILDAPELDPQIEQTEEGPEEMPEEPVEEEVVGVYVNEKHWWNDYAQAMQDIIFGAEKRWIRAYKGFVDAMARSVKRRFEKRYLVPLHADEWRSYWEEMSRGLGESMWVEAGQIVLVEEEYAKRGKCIGYDGVIKDIQRGRHKSSPLRDLMTAEEQAAFFNDMNAWLSKVYKLSDDSINSLNAVVTPLYARGTNMAELTEEIAKWNDGQYNKAMTIARNISHAGFNASRYSMFQKRGVLTHKWVSSNDKFVRQTHVLENTHEVKIGEPFPVTQCRFPHDPNGRIEETINCRCTTVATSYQERGKVDVPKTEDLAKPVQGASKVQLVKRVFHHKMFKEQFADADIGTKELKNLTPKELERLEEWLDMQAVRATGLRTEETIEFRPANVRARGLDKWKKTELNEYKAYMFSRPVSLGAKAEEAIKGMAEWEATTRVGNYTTGRVMKVYNEIGDICDKLKVSPLVKITTEWGSEFYGASPMSHNSVKKKAARGLIGAVHANKKIKAGAKMRKFWEEGVADNVRYASSARTVKELEKHARTDSRYFAVRTTDSKAFFNRAPKKGDIVDTPYCSAGPSYFEWSGDTKIIFKLPKNNKWWDENVLFTKINHGEGDAMLSNWHREWTHSREEEMVLRNYWKVQKTGKLQSTGQRFVVLQPISQKEVAKMAHKATKAALTGYIHRPVQTLEELEAESRANDEIRAWAKEHWKQAKKDMPDMPDTMIMAYLTRVYPNYVAP